MQARPADADGFVEHLGVEVHYEVFGGASRPFCCCRPGRSFTNARWAGWWARSTWSAAPPRGGTAGPDPAPRDNRGYRSPWRPPTQALVDDVHTRLQDEFWPAFLDTLVVWARPRRVPVLVLGAERDGFFTLGEMRRIAAAYRTQAEVMTGMGHDLMLDQGWPEVADPTDAWVREAATLDAGDGLR